MEYTNKNKKRMILFTTRGYSNSTARHKNYVWSALMNVNNISALPIVETLLVGEITDKTIVKDIQKRRSEAILKGAKARTDHMRYYWKHEAERAEKMLNYFLPN
jgi:CBS domain-containing protein